MDSTDPYRNRIYYYGWPDDQYWRDRPGAGRRESGCHGADFAGAATRCVRDHHPDIVCRAGDNRVACHLLFRGLHDSDFRQPVLESCYCAGRGKIIRADRLVHRYCASRQLPHPGVVAEAFFLSADPQGPGCERKTHRRGARRCRCEKSEAEKERREFQQKNDEFDQQRRYVSRQALDEAAAERKRLIAAARNDADNLRTRGRKH